MLVVTFSVDIFRYSVCSVMYLYSCSNVLFKLPVNKVATNLEPGSSLAVLFKSWILSLANH